MDVRAGELRKHGIKLRLRGQPLQVLEILLEHAGEVVTREEVQSRIWPGSAFGDFDHNLHNAVARIREVLGDSPDNPRYIETLPRRGYRYIGPIEDFQTLRLAPDPRGRTMQPAAVIAPPKRHRSLVLVVCALVTLAVAAWAIWSYVHAKSAFPPIRSVAVLPLANLSGDPSQDFFADGMTDQLITDLAQIGALRVSSRTSVMRYKGQKKGLPEIARELNVDAIVEGSVIRSGQRVRVTAQLLQGSTDRHLWAQTYDGDLGDILKLQGEVANAIAQQVRAQLTPTQQSQLQRTHAVNPAAYDAYLRGRLYFVNEFTNPDSLRQAQHYFEESIQKDPKFALAYAGLADAYVYLAYAGAMPKDQAYRSAKDQLAKALDLDASIGEAYDTLGALSSNFDWDWDAADREFNRAIALAPSYSCAHEDRAEFLASRGRRAEALAEIAQIDQLDYGFSAAGTVSATYSQLRDYPRLIEASKRGLLLDPKDWSQHFYLGLGYEGAGRLPEAISEYRKATEMSGGAGRPSVALAHAYLATGERARGEKIFRDLERLSKTTSLAPFTMATIYAGLGEKDQAFAFLEKAYSEKSLGILAPLKSDFALDGLRSDPRFQSLLRRIGLN